MNENWNPFDECIDCLLDSSTPYSKRRKLLQGLGKEEIDEVLDYAKRVIEVEPQLAHRLIEDIYGLQL